MIFIVVGGLLGTSKLDGLPGVSRWSGWIEEGQYINIPSNSDVISPGFIKISLSANDDVGFGFRKSSYDMLVIPGRQYNQSSQAGICNSFRPQGNVVYLDSIIYGYDENSILRNLYLKFNARAYVNVAVYNTTGGGISIKSSASGSTKNIEVGYNIAI